MTVSLIFFIKYLINLYILFWILEALADIFFKECWASNAQSNEKRATELRSHLCGKIEFIPLGFHDKVILWKKNLWNCEMTTT